MKIMATHLQRRGYRTHQVSYNFLSREPAQNAQALLAEIASIDTQSVHLVGHSLGGIVILHLLQQQPVLPPGKVVLIGSPVKGSAFAKRIHKHKALRPLLGKSIERGLLGGAPNFSASRPLGIITGSQRFGLGAMVFGPHETNDGVVAESETRLAQATDHVCVPYTHSMMIFSRRCADLVANFLSHSRFS